MCVLFVIVPIVYNDGFQQMEKWNSCFVDCVSSKQKLKHPTVVNNTKVKFEQNLPKWNPNMFIVDDANVNINVIK
jgi:hypothetical protein